MKKIYTDIAIVGAGPVGLMCAYLAKLCGMNSIIFDKSAGPLKVGRADALNARTLQLFEIVNLFNSVYPLGKVCNTSSVWENGKFISRQSAWWESIEGCFHKHFLMVGQSFIEHILDEKLNELNNSVIRKTEALDIKISENYCETKLSTEETVYSKYVIGADGAHSFVRKIFNISFEITKPKLTWAVLDAEILTNFPKVPEIIVFQNETSDVAWIPREGNIDRFYIRMDEEEITLPNVLNKIKKAITPYEIALNNVNWFSQFSVKESLAEQYSIANKVFLVGDAAHIHSVNGGQGLNTGIADAFNLIWKIHSVSKQNSPIALLDSYEHERKPVALSVIETSGKLVRSTKFSENNTHAIDYVKIVEKHAGNITGMGIYYKNSDCDIYRLHDFFVYKNNLQKRIYSLLKYSSFTLLVFLENKKELKNLSLGDVQVIEIYFEENKNEYWTKFMKYKNQVLLVRPDSYIQQIYSLKELEVI
ncbi:FAD-binding protein [Pigmentibacter sp. JX0631]|uniref:FAD-binding protein n=1 Tax=Pigmentibacter sp. JX0631 TaxID=2976982 RepID=UPI0024685094|nr:FAD-binding protein [Pigmentibacter sp. JX0631]WGL59739.1 FAD-binding protein [Pigmentibacter sp. JX0631]